MATCRYDYCGRNGLTDGERTCPRCRIVLIKVLAKLQTGTLPGLDHIPVPPNELLLEQKPKVTRCSVCDKVIEAGEYHYGETISGDDHLRVHLLCWEIWMTSDRSDELSRRA